MLTSLYIENIAVVKKLGIEWDGGFSVMTGETGAGKSIVADCLGLLAGNKTDRELIRSGESRATVTAIFSVDEDKRAALGELGFEPDENGELEIVRTMTADGRSSVRANRRGVTLAALREAGELLINIHGQGESAFLTNSSYHAELLDEYAELDAMLSEYSELYRKYSEADERLRTFRETLKNREMMSDVLKYQLKEIEAAKLTSPDEEDKLRKARAKLKGYEQISKLTGIISRSLLDNEKGTSASDLTARAAKAIDALSSVLDGAEEMSQRLTSIRYELIDIGERCMSVVDDGIDDPEKQLDAVETRLALIERLERKYGSDVSEIIKKREELRASIKELEDSDATEGELDRRRGESYKNALALAESIGEKRKSAAEALAAEVTKTLVYLDMPKVRFTVNVASVRDRDGNSVLNSRGCNTVEFLISTNPGEEPKALARIASGGELSRVLLALKSELSGKKGAETIIFDEIDAGVSGATSEKIGNKLKAISKGAQVICVTHSAQIAALADTHYTVEKCERDGRMESSVRRLDIDERADELARIIGGVTVTEIQRETAREMLRGRQNQ